MINNNNNDDEDDDDDDDDGPVKDNDELCDSAKIR